MTIVRNVEYDSELQPSETLTHHEYIAAQHQTINTQRPIGTNPDNSTEGVSNTLSIRIGNPL